MKARIHLTLRDGSHCDIEADYGSSLMEAIRDSGVDELMALCGGCCSCATCHVHLDATSFAGLPIMVAGEDDLLDGSPTRTATSRLACQLQVDRGLDGARVTIAAED